MFSAERDGDRLAGHFARPLVAAATGSQTRPIHHRALADGARLGQTLPEPFVLALPSRNRRHFFSHAAYFTLDVQP